MFTQPETRYARNGTIHLAYQVLGEGPVNLVGVGSGPRRPLACCKQPAPRRIQSG